MTIHILCTGRRRGRGHYDHSHIVIPLEDGVGGIVGTFMTIHILCTARRRGSGTL